MTDSISQLISTIKNGYLAGKKQVTCPYSKFKEEILKVLVKENFLEKLEVRGKKAKKEIVCFLRYKGKQPAVEEIRMISKPGLRVYQKANDKTRLKRGQRIRILSTPKGVMTENEAFKKNFGGEVVLEIY